MVIPFNFHLSALFANRIQFRKKSSNKIAKYVHTYFWSSVSKPSEWTISSTAPKIDITNVEHLNDAVQIVLCDLFYWLVRFRFDRLST